MTLRRDRFLFRFEDSDEISPDVFHEREDQVVERVEEVLGNVTDEYEDTDLILEKEIVEWGKVHGNSPTVSVVVEYEGLWVEEELLDELTDRLTETVKNIYDDFEFERREIAGLH